MKNPTVKLSRGAEWAIDRMPNSLYPSFQKDMEEAISSVLHQYGYNSGIAMAFREDSPVYVERSE